MLSSVQGPLESFKEISKPGDLHRVFVKSDVKLKKNVFENLFYLCLVVICRLLIDPQYNLYLEGLACLLCTLAIAYYYHRSNRSLYTDRRAVCFVTSRPAKFIEVATLLSPIPVVYEDLSLRTLEKTNDLVIDAVDRVLAAFERTQCRTFLEETALYVKNNNYL